MIAIYNQHTVDGSNDVARIRLACGRVVRVRSSADGNILIIPAGAMCSVIVEDDIPVKTLESGLRVADLSKMPGLNAQEER
jgi:hypothetical protein